MILALLVVHVILGSLSLLVGRGLERPLALRYWGYGLLVYATGLLIGLPSGLPHSYNRVLSIAVVGIAAMLTTSALIRNSAYRFNWTIVGAAYCVALLLVAVNHSRAEPSLSFDYLVPAAFPNGLFLFGAFALFRTPAADARTPSRFLGGMLLFAVLVWSLRVTFVVHLLAGTNDRTRADLAISLFAIAQIGAAVGSTLGLFWVEVRKMDVTLRWLAGTDVLTALPNRRATMIKFQEEAARGVRHRRPYSIIVFDIDNFKKVNDEYGHAFGDEVLKQVARTLEQEKREVDVVGRFGGEEFVVILSEEGGEGASVAAARLHAHVRDVPGPDAGAVIPLTMSGGVASAPEDGSTWDELFAAADRRLYEAKRAGRDRVVSGGPPLRSVAAPGAAAASARI